MKKQITFGIAAVMGFGFIGAFANLWARRRRDG